MSASATLDLQLMQAAYLLETDPQGAAGRAQAILVQTPGHPEASLLLATALRKLGKAAEAAAALESLTEADRDTPLMQLELGRAYAASGRSAAATTALRRAATLDAGLADAWRELADQLFAAGDAGGGDLAYAHYSRLAPPPPELNEAVFAIAQSRLDSAEALLMHRLEQAPRDVNALRMLAQIATRLENFALAEVRLTTCLALAPGYAQARYELGTLLQLQQRSVEVLPLVDRLLAVEPDNIDFLSLKAQALRLVTRSDEAVALMEQAVASHPQDERACTLFGHLLREVGQQARAIELYRRAIEVRPQHGHAYSSLANLKTFRFTPADITAMEQQLAGQSLRREERIHFEFALGKALEDEGNFARSFEHYAAGNQMQRPFAGHDAEATSADIRRAKAVHTPGFFADRAGWGSPRRDPIFIVGLPRSGSTLLEQMLASHSQVEGTRELTDITALAEASHAQAANSLTYPESLTTLGREAIEALAARYLQRTQIHRVLGKPHFVDKMLGNYGHIGFIHLLFPHAPIIDARRHPLACGFSCYRQLFARGCGFTYDLEDFGRYYRDYASLLDHFDTVLPKRVYRVHYEHVVADPEGELRKLLDYCGLPFESHCLQFHENRRVVQTISSEQVRRPIYTEGIDQWRHYETWLEPMRKALGDLVDRYPPAPTR